MLLKQLSALLLLTRVHTLQAAPRRQAKVAKQIEREVGNLLLTDKVLH